MWEHNERMESLSFLNCLFRTYRDDLKYIQQLLHISYPLMISQAIESKWTTTTWKLYIKILNEKVLMSFLFILNPHCVRVVARATQKKTAREFRRMWRT